MEPDVVEIAPPIASASRTRKPRKGLYGFWLVFVVLGFFEFITPLLFLFAVGLTLIIDYVLTQFPQSKFRAVVPEVIDVEEYEIRNFDKKNKGKAIELNSFTFNNNQSHPPHHGLETYQEDCYEINPVSKSMKANGTQSFATPKIQQWEFFPGSVFPQNNQQPNYLSPNSFPALQNQTPDVMMMAQNIPFNPLNFDASASSSRPIAPQDSSSSVRKIKEEFLRDFKRFDTVGDFSDHHYASKGKASKQHSKNWVKKIQTDWKILENDLPETIFVRACETRMDLMRAVIIGAEGTPYHDGLYFFDIQFPDTYPSVPPIVHYHSGGLRINPNLYHCGKVCLSLLGTWSGSTREKWIPKESTMLQLLVSIQALILNQKPYFNEPGYERTKGSKSGEAHSKAYSENVFILSLRTMVYSMRRPPQHFEEFVRNFFFLRAHDIVKACNAYKDGAPVASMVKGGVQDLEESSESGSKKFRADVVGFMKTAIDEFVKLGVKKLEVTPTPPPANTVSHQATRKRGRGSR